MYHFNSVSERKKRKEEIMNNITAIFIPICLGIMILGLIIAQHIFN